MSCLRCNLVEPDDQNIMSHFGQAKTKPVIDINSFILQRTLGSQATLMKSVLDFLVRDIHTCGMLEVIL